MVHMYCFYRINDLKNFEINIAVYKYISRIVNVNRKKYHFPKKNRNFTITLELLSIMFFKNLPYVNLPYNVNWIQFHTFRAILSFFIASNICWLNMFSSKLLSQARLFICEVRRTQGSLQNIFSRVMLRNQICFNLH